MEPYPPLACIAKQKAYWESVHTAQSAFARSTSLCVSFINASEDIVCVKTGAVPLLGVYSKKVQPLDLAPDSLVSPEPTR